MPKYRVTKPRFFGGVFYEPENNNILIVEEPFKKDKDGNLPSGLELLKDEPQPEVKKGKGKATAPQPDSATIAAEAREPANPDFSGQPEVL